MPGWCRGSRGVGRRDRPAPHRHRSHPYRTRVQPVRHSPQLSTLSTSFNPANRAGARIPSFHSLPASNPNASSTSGRGSSGSRASTVIIPATPLPQSSCRSTRFMGSSKLDVLRHHALPRREEAVRAAAELSPDAPFQPPLCASGLRVPPARWRHEGEPSGVAGPRQRRPPQPRFGSQTWWWWRACGCKPWPAFVRVSRGATRREGLPGELCAAPPASNPPGRARPRLLARRSATACSVSRSAGSFVTRRRNASTGSRRTRTYSVTIRRVVARQGRRRPHPARCRGGRGGGGRRGRAGRLSRDATPPPAVSGAGAGDGVGGQCGRRRRRASRRRASAAVRSRRGIARRAARPPRARRRPLAGGGGDGTLPDAMRKSPCVLASPCRRMTAPTTNVSDEETRSRAESLVRWRWRRWRRSRYL